MDFSLNCAWLLDAYTWDANLPSGYCKKRSHGTKLRNLILSGELVPRDSIAREVKFRDMLNSTASSSSSTRHHSHRGHPHHHHRVPNPDVSSLAAPPPSSSNSTNRSA